MDLISVALLLIFLGFILVFADVILTAVRAMRQGEEETKEGEKNGGRRNNIHRPYSYHFWKFQKN